MAKKKRIKVILDTNWFISATINRKSRRNLYNLLVDTKDNYLLSMTIDGKTDYLVTGDLDLLVIKKIGRTKIVTMAAFLGAIQG